MHFEDTEWNAKMWIYRIAALILFILIVGAFYALDDKEECGESEALATITLPAPDTQPVRAYDATSSGHLEIPNE